MFICKEDNRRRSGLRQDCQMPQMDIYTSHCHELFLNSSLVCLNNSYYPNACIASCCMGVCCNSPLLGRKGVRENEIF